MAICIICGKEFTPKTKTAKVCYRDHYKTCPVCGKSFFIGRHDYKRKTCSPECSRILRKKHAEETSLKKYGVKNAGYTKESQAKIKATNLEKYGSETYFASDSAKEHNKAVWKEKYGVDNPQKSKEIREKVKKTNLEKYGDTNPLGKNSWKRKEVDQENIKKYGVANLGGTEESKKKIKQTHFERYGTWYSKSEEGRSRIESTNKEKYGSKSPFGNSAVQEKIKQANIERYGTQYPMQSDVIKDRIKDKYGSAFGFGSDKARESISRTLREKYGVENISQVPEVREKVAQTNKRKYGSYSYTQSNDYRQKTNFTCNSKYGVPWPCMTEACRESSPNTISKLNKAFGEELSKNNIEFEFEYPIESYSYDFIIKTQNILIEIDPTYTHSLYGDTIFSHVDLNYHSNKSKVAKQHGFRCIHIFDWDNCTKIINMIREDKVKIGGRNCKVEAISSKDANKCLNDWHLQNTCRGIDIAIGLIYNDEIVGVATFGNPRYNKKYQYELLRLCSNPNYVITGGSQKLFSYFVKTYDPKSIISYCDKSKFAGNVYTSLEFEHFEAKNPSIHWSKPGTRIHYTDNLVRALGVDKLLGTNFGKGSDNNQILLDNGFLPIADCGQDVYTWRAE